MSRVQVIEPRAIMQRDMWMQWALMLNDSTYEIHETRRVLHWVPEEAVPEPFLLKGFC